MHSPLLGQSVSRLATGLTPETSYPESLTGPEFFFNLKKENIKLIVGLVMRRKAEIMKPIEHNLSVLDRPEVLQYIFYPRRDSYDRPLASNASNHFIPVEKNISIGCRFHVAGKEEPNLLFFHGNGEIVGDYDDIASLYNQRGINFFVADYRGYGLSGGRPTASALILDGHSILKALKQILKEKEFSGKLFIMGRSLGSAPAIDLLASCPEGVAGLIIESGFADTIALLSRIGVSVRDMGFIGGRGFSNLEKIRSIKHPILIIHAEDDYIIPLADAEKLFSHSSAMKKRLLVIPGANHNDILYCGEKEYFQAIEDFVYER